MDAEKVALLAEVAAWHRRMNLELSDKGSEWAAKEMYACPHGRFATALEAIASQPTQGGADENDIAAALLSVADSELGITLTDWLQAADFSLGDRLNFGLRMARAVLAIPHPQPGCERCEYNDGHAAHDAAGRIDGGAEYAHDATPPPPSDAAQGDMDRVVRFGDLPAPLTNPEAWPPNYADGWNAACKTMAYLAHSQPVRVDEAMVDACERLLSVFDEQAAIAQRIFTGGRSDAALREQGNKALSDIRAAIRAIRRALEQPGSAAGFVMVPAIPTQDMVQIGVDQYRTDNFSDISIQGKVRRIYANMIDAAPKQGDEK